MRFYAERERRIAPRSAAEALRDRLRDVSTAPPGPARHAALAGALVRAGELAQGIADAERGAALQRAPRRPPVPARGAARRRPRGGARRGEGRRRHRRRGPGAVGELVPRRGGGARGGRGRPGAAARLPEPRRGAWRRRRRRGPRRLRAPPPTPRALLAGLGDAGEAALARARALAAAGLVPAPAGLRHGFLVETFERGALPLPLASLPRARVLGAVRRHLAFVAARFPAAEGEGAGPRELAAVAVENARELLGGEAAAAVGRLLDERLPEVERLARPVASDGRLQRWEWLVRSDGTVLKADALDHHRDHALVGCQDALWDVAGATLELGLSGAEAAKLAGDVRGASRGAPPRWLPFFLVAYGAFEAGRWAAAAAEPGLAADEAARRRAEAVRLADALRRVVGTGRVERAPRRGTLDGS